MDYLYYVLTIYANPSSTTISKHCLLLSTLSKQLHVLSHPKMPNQCLTHPNNALPIQTLCNTLNHYLTHPNLSTTQNQIQYQFSLMFYLCIRSPIIMITKELLKINTDVNDNSHTNKPVVKRMITSYSSSVI